MPATVQEKARPGSSSGWWTCTQPVVARPGCWTFSLSGRGRSCRTGSTSAAPTGAFGCRSPLDPFPRVSAGTRPRCPPAYAPPQPRPTSLADRHLPDAATAGADA
jgi:hypothetical protein